MVAETAGSAASGDRRERRVTQSALRRESVLKYPDLARALTEPPLGFRRPEEWNGYIPPGAMPQDACPQCRNDPGRRGCRNPMHTAPLNNSPRRTALVALVEEASRRDKAEQAAHE